MASLSSGTLILNPATDGPTGPDDLTLVEDGTADVIASASSSSPTPTSRPA